MYSNRATKQKHRAFKGEGHSKKLTFLPSPIASEHSAFSLTEVLASEMPAILMKFVSKETIRRQPFWTVLGSQDVFKWRHSVRLEIGGKEKNTQTTNDFHASQGQQNVFFPSDYPLHYLHCCHFRSLEHVWLKIIRLKSIHNAEW